MTTTPVITAAEYRALAFRDEEAFLQHVLALAKWGRWMPFHVRRSKGSHPGFPDLVLARPGRLCFAELKMPAGRLSLAQRDWQAMLRTVAALTDGCVQVHEWRPGDLDAIERLLIGGAG